jgi:endonuclease/exonuclease/phosphatase family metal-dependent hydrolase
MSFLVHWALGASPQVHAVDSQPELLPSPSLDSAAPISSFSLLTYNVNCAFEDGCAWRNRANRTEDYDAADYGLKVVQAISDADADLVLLQETNSTWEQLITSLLKPKLYAHVHFFANKSRRGAGGSAFLSRFPIDDMQLLDNKRHVDGSWFAMLVGKVTLPGMAADTCVRLVNVHLRPPIADKATYGSIPPPWIMSSTSVNRKAELQYLIDTLGPIDDAATAVKVVATIVAGDFNETEAYSAIQMMQSEYNFRDALSRTDGPTHRWEMFQGGWMTITLRLDHILYTSGTLISNLASPPTAATAVQEPILACTSCIIVPGYERGASDHLPVKSDFVLLPASAATASAAANPSTTAATS